MLSSQFIRFLLVNSVAAFFNIMTRLLSSFVFLDVWAVVAGFCAGLSTSYLLCRVYVFRNTMKPPSMAEVFRFILVNLIALILTWAIYQLSLQAFLLFTRKIASDQWMRTAAHTIGVAAPVAFSFAAQKTFTFRQRFGPNGT